MSLSMASGFAPLASGLFSLIDELFTTQEEKDNAKLRLIELEQKGQLAQLAVNTQEAQHASLFVAGWRPFIGWVCGIAFTWAFLVYPILELLISVGWNIPHYMLPELDTSDMLTVLMGMLGIGGLRTFEKLKGVERNSLGSPEIDRRGN